MFPSLFSDSNNKNLHYDICELTKYKRVPFTHSNKRNNYSFHLVHNDTSDPSNVPNIFEVQ